MRKNNKSLNDSSQATENYVVPACKAPKSSYTFFPNKSSKRLKAENLIFWDIETIRAGDKIKNSADDLEAHSLNPLNLTQIAILFSEKHLTKKSLQILESNDVRRYRRSTAFEGYVEAILDAGTPTETANLFVELRLSLRRNLIGATFNGFRFDTGILTHLWQGTDSIDAKISRSKLLSVRATDKKNIREIDLRPWGQAVGCSSLKALSSIVKMPKLEILQDTQDGFDTYNIRDCEVMLAFVNLLNELGIYSHHMPNFARAKMAESLETGGYGTVYSSRNFGRFNSYGARCEAYKSDLSSTIEVDANSLYPSIMSSTEFPAILKTSTHSRVDMRELRPAFFPVFYDIVESFDFSNSAAPNETFKKWMEHTNHTHYSALVRIDDCEESVKHIFPFGIKTKEGSLHFKLVKGATYEIFGYEAMFLKFCNFTVLKLFVSKSDFLPFSDYIKNTYAQRKKYKAEKNPLEMMLKIILNAGYGVWGARGDKKSAVTDIDTVKRFNDVITEATEALGENANDYKIFVELERHGISENLRAVKKLGGRFMQYDFFEPRFVKMSIPSIAIFTLSNARAFMYLSILAAGSENIYYTDTDSLFVSEKGFENLQAVGLIGGEMLQLKIEARIKEGYAAGQKLYAALTDKGYIDSHKGLQSFSDCEISRLSYHSQLAISTRRLYDPDSGTKRTLSNGIFFNIPSEEKNEAFKDVIEKLVNFEASFKT